MTRSGRSRWATDDDGTLIPAMKHTSTATKTSTASQDRQGDDSDTDSTGT